MIIGAFCFYEQPAVAFRRNSGRLPYRHTWSMLPDFSGVWVPHLLLLLCMCFPCLVFPTFFWFPPESWFPWLLLKFLVQYTNIYRYFGAFSFFFSSVLNMSLFYFIAYMGFVGYICFIFSRFGRVLRFDFLLFLFFGILCWL